MPFCDLNKVTQVWKSKEMADWTPEEKREMIQLLSNSLAADVNEAYKQTREDIREKDGGGS